MLCSLQAATTTSFNTLLVPGLVTEKVVPYSRFPVPDLAESRLVK
jgi:hypothetical protein